MKCLCAVTFEFDRRAPVTWHGTIEGWSAHTIVHRAVEQAHQTLAPRGWSSLNCVILERQGRDVESPEDVQTDDPA